MIGDAGTNPLRFEVDERLKRFKEFPSKTTYDLLVNNVTAARNGGVDVSDVEPRLPELEKRALRFEVDERLKRFKEFPSKTTYDLLVNNVTAARNGGVDVSDVEPRLPELEKLIKI